MEASELEEARRQTEERLLLRNRPIRIGLIGQLEELPRQPAEMAGELLSAIQAQWNDLGSLLDGEEELNLQYEATLAKMQSLLRVVEEKQAEVHIKRREILQRLESISKEEVFSSKDEYDDCLRMWLYYKSVEAPPEDDLNRFERLVHKIQPKVKRVEHDEKVFKLEKLCEELSQLHAKQDIKPVEKQNELKRLCEESKKLKLHVGPKAQKLQAQFWGIVSNMKQELGWEIWNGTKRKEDLLAKAEQLLAEGVVAELGAKLKELQDEWKTIGFTHKSDDALWDKFKETCSRIYEKHQAFQKANEALKEQLIAKAEALQNQENMKSTAEEFKLLQQQWKEVGSIHIRANEKLNRRFGKICKAFFDKRREHFKEVKEDQKENLKKKESLVLMAEKVAKESNWKLALPKIKDLQEQWKKTGHVAKAKSDEVWNKFQAACNLVYEKKRGEDEKADAEFEGNLTKKDEILKQMEEALAGTDLVQVGKALDALEKQWNEIGYVPSKKRKAIEMRHKKIWSDLADKEKKIQEEKDRAHDQNAQTKSGICQKLEDIALAKSWTAEDPQVAALKAEWEATGMATGEKELKKRYRQVMDILSRQPDDKALGNMDKAQEENLDKLKLLCIKVESLAGIEPEDMTQEMRRQWMVAELKAKMGRKTHGPGNKQSEARKLLDEMQAISLIPAEKREPFDQRIKKALGKLGAA